jgi:hypothetical protein
MARGRLLKTKIREAEHLAAATVRGRTHAQQKAEKDKDYLVSLREHLGKMIDRIDPLETAAVFALTPIIEPILETAVVAGSLSFEVVTNWLKIWSFPFLGFPSGPSAEELQKMVESGRIGMYLLAFVVSFILIRHGAEIASAGVKGISGIVGVLGLAA